MAVLEGAMLMEKLSITYETSKMVNFIMCARLFSS